MRRDWDSELFVGTSVGFTGTRRKITSFQREKLVLFLEDIKPLVVHFGDCEGADYEMFLLCKAFRIWTVAHPPDNPLHRMFTKADEIRDVKPYLVRNMDIVDSSEYLVACPGEDSEVLRSGTWMTVRYARKIGRAVVLIHPDGDVDVTRGEW